MVGTSMGKQMTHPLSLGQAIRQLSRFNALDRKMQVSTILTLLEVAAADQINEEITIGDIERRTGMRTGTSTRNVYYWAEGHAEVRGGHRFIEIISDEKDKRRRLLKLTPLGRSFIRSLSE
jgi:DNA-binding MarR family transcriptional regulator